MPSCNWAFGCAIGLFVITLIIILVILLGGTDNNGEEKIIIIPAPTPTPAPALAAAPAPAPAPAPAKLGFMNNVPSSRVTKGRVDIMELSSAKEAAQLLKGSKPVLVLFYGDFCGHCKQMMPDFEQAAMDASSKSGIIIAKVESGKLKDMASVSSDLPAINGFPTMCTNYEEGQPKIKAHVGRKDKAFLENIMRGAMGAKSPSAPMGVRASGKRQMVEYSSMQDACAALKGKEKTIVMAYADWCGHCKAMKADFEALVEKAPAGITVGRLNSDAIKQGQGCDGVEEIKDYPTILFNNGSKIIKVMGRQQMSALMDLLKK